MSRSALRMGEKRKEKLDAVLSEYNDLRDEIKRRIDQRTQITGLMVTIDGTLAGFAIYTGNLFILGLIPFVSVFCLLNIKSSYIIHKRLTRYIREIIECQKLRRNIFKGSNKLWISWETFYETVYGDKPKSSSGGGIRLHVHQVLASGTRRHIYEVFEVFLCLVCRVAISYYSFLKLDSMTALLISFFYAVFAFVAILASIMPQVYRKDSEKYDWEELNALTEQKQTD
jgi:hypothetical protein